MSSGVLVIYGMYGKAAFLEEGHVCLVKRLVVELIDVLVTFAYNDTTCRKASSCLLELIFAVSDIFTSNRHRMQLLLKSFLRIVLETRYFTMNN